VPPHEGPLGSPPPNKALQLASAVRGVLGPRRPELASLAGRLEAAGGGAAWATVSGQRRSQLSADPLGSVLRYSLPPEIKSSAGWCGGVSLPGSRASCSYRSVAGHLQRQALSRFAVSSGYAIPPAGCSKGRRRDGWCAHRWVPVLAGAGRFPLHGSARKYARSPVPAVRRRLGQRTRVGVLGGSRRSEACCLTRRCS
jgi:hypothetical protein